MIESTIEVKRLLVLDDENDVAEMICMMAATSAFETEHTDDVENFLNKALSWKPTHVIVDLHLADRDGIEVLHRLAAFDCKSAVIIISGLGGRILDSSSRAASENGLSLIGTLLKPFSKGMLMDLLALEAPELPDQNYSPTSPQLNVTQEQLIDALHARVFTVHFQPKISCLTGKLVGFECLARWQHQKGGMIPPDVFITLAEQSDLIHELTRQIYHYALTNLPYHANKSGLTFALNLSPINLKDENFPNWLKKECQENDVSPSQIILEMTETGTMDQPLVLLERLTQFRIHGFKLSIDDFGVGYSSLVQLARLPFSELKVDQMFVKTLATSEESRKIVTAVVGMGNSLGLNVVAEGVEDSWALEFLHNMGCDEAQGYYIARPMNNLAAKAWRAEAWNIET